ncbi:dnaJ homolog subfamily C member 8 [Toxorhynchites rutilus septentrionalis]|uniref:dnaJ homolog subfamily C member 8 n=1 Tax=Toxorhynchites rutilus septentrionalis TaxID=329112 RepID=UPI002478F623|nr:dnaJ homolog subfamily C member 8 [Toxorhynchites rutilus septentrionalis]
MWQTPMAHNSGSEDQRFDVFYNEVKQIEKRDSVLTSKQQIDRLLRPGASYFNLNPFEVLQLEPDTPIEQIKKKYRSLSILVHPDKNQDNIERAQQAFEVVNKAYKILENELTRKRCLEVYEEAKDRTDMMITEKRKKLRKEGKSDSIPEDDSAKYKHAVYVMVMKLFADMERRRQQLEVRDQEERKRKREQEIEEEEQRNYQKEWQKNFEESRQNRVNSWQNFQASASSSTPPIPSTSSVSAAVAKPKKAKKAKYTSFNPPKIKPETR